MTTIKPRNIRRRHSKSFVYLLEIEYHMYSWRRFWLKHARQVSTNSLDILVLIDTNQAKPVLVDVMPIDNRRHCIRHLKPFLSDLNESVAKVPGSKKTGGNAR